MGFSEAAVLEEAPAGHRRTALDRDAELVEGLRRRDTAAAEALVTTYGDRVYRLALRITGNGSDAEEVVQDSLWAAARKIDSFRGTAAFGSWVYRITANAAYQKRRGPPAGRSQAALGERFPVPDQSCPPAAPG